MGLESKPEIYWVSAAQRFSLSARTRVQSLDHSREDYWGGFGLTETDLVEIQQWCQDNNCGKRTSFDTFQFRNRQEITAFLLRWS